jgi:hypothetical protein
MFPQPTDRRGVHGAARPAFTVHRFKRTITINVNEEMAEELGRVLDANESRQDRVPPFMHEFLTQVYEALDQRPPAQGEKPATLAPGRPRPEGRARPVVKAV